ncbi:hypothetical protein CHUAL_010158 [Chamberlinius hualienensis]
METNVEDDGSSSGSSSEAKKSENDSSSTRKPISNNSLQRFQELKRRREELTTFSQWKLKKLNDKKSSQRKSNESCTTNDTAVAKHEAEWEDIKTNYMDVNTHLVGPVSHGEPKSGLEEDVNIALSKGDIDKAEQLSDKLAHREYGVRLHEAFGAKRYAEKMKVKRESQKKKKLKPRWGLVKFKRWEMKGNM